MAIDVPTMFEIQIEPERLVNAAGAPCWVHVTEIEAREIYERLHAQFSGANKKTASLSCWTANNSAERIGRMDTNQIDAEIVEIDLLAEICANGDGDCADGDKAAEDALLFRVLKAIAQGHPEPQSLAAYVIDECATKLRGRCYKEASEMEHMAITLEQMKTVLQSADDVLVRREDGSFSPLKPGERIYTGSAERALAFFQRLESDPELASLANLLSQRK